MLPSSLFDFQPLVTAATIIAVVLRGPGQLYMAVQGKVNVLIFDV